MGLSRNLSRWPAASVFGGFLMVFGLTVGAKAQAPEPKLTTVGMVTRDYADDTRRNWEGTAARPLRTAIWYPVEATASNESFFGGVPQTQAIFTPIPVAAGAKISNKAAKYPLILLSHGTGGSAVMLMWLGYRLASLGYIAAAVTHHGNSLEEGKVTPQGFLLFSERPKDVSAVLDKLLADPLFGPRIDRAHIGASGFSLGGYTVLALAGAQFSREAFQAFCSSPKRDFTCEPQPEFPDAWQRFQELEKTDPYVQESVRHLGDSFRDSRIKAVFAIAPALGMGLTEASLRQITIPVGFAVGAGDHVCPAATNAGVVAGIVKGAKLTILPGEVAHYTFLAYCTEHGRVVVPICRDGQSVDRNAVHETVARLVYQFYEDAWRSK